MAPLTQVKKDGITWPVTNAIVNTDVNTSAAIAGSKLANLVSNDADNRLLTATGTANSFNGEANLTFDGTSLNLPTVNTWIKGGGHNVLQVDATMSYLYGGSGGAQFRNADNSSALVQILNDGKIGIGTTSPQVTGIHINGTNARLQLTDSTTGAASGDGVIFGLNGDQDFFINNREDDKHILFFTESTERLRITNAGKIGMGTSAPVTNLDVKTEHASNEANLYVRNNTVNYKVRALSDNAQAGTETNHPFHIISNNAFVARFDGDGIKFGNDTAAANALDDYEEGTWTPALTNGPTLTSAKGYYTKIGRVVNAAFYFNTSNDGSAAHVRINNLPFTSATDNTSGYNGVGAGGVAWDYGTSSVRRGHIPANSTLLYFYNNTGGAMEGSSSDFESKEWRGTAIYITN